jgi:hypothetical protein
MNGNFLLKASLNEQCVEAEVAGAGVSQLPRMRHSVCMVSDFFYPGFGPPRFTSQRRSASLVVASPHAHTAAHSRSPHLPIVSPSSICLAAPITAQCNKLASHPAPCERRPRGSETAAHASPRMPRTPRSPLGGWIGARDTWRRARATVRRA